MSLIALGVNHKTAPVGLRERVAFTREQLPDALHALARLDGVREAAILSTCNRTEIYCGAQQFDPSNLIRWLGTQNTVEERILRPHLYWHPDREAVRHMMRVASGLDSMVLGEPQILGQVKDAYQEASAAGTLGQHLERLFQHAFSVAKQVRTDTRIGASPVSVAFAAVSLARQIFGDLSRQSALLLGAGEAIELVARHLTQQGIGHLVVANRTLERAHGLASRFGGLAITLDEIPKNLDVADIVVSSTGSSEPILFRPEVERALERRKHRPVLMVDIAVPRDISSDVGTLPDVYLYTVDDLEEIISESMRSRQHAAGQAEEIIDARTDDFMLWMRSLDAVHTICEIRGWSDEVRRQVLSTAKRQLAAGRPIDDVLEQFGQTLTHKLLHGPSVALRRAGAEGREDLLRLIQHMFRPGSRQRR